MNARVAITKMYAGLCGMQVCAVDDASDDEILAICNRENPAGTERGWCRVAREDFEQDNARPVPCERDPARRHFMVVC